jgi:hypothetical protein
MGILLFSQPPIRSSPVTAPIGSATINSENGRSPFFTTTDKVFTGHCPISSATIYGVNGYPPFFSVSLNCTVS